MTRSVSILGSTGSVGAQAIEVAMALGLRVTALAANSNTVLMEQQARRLMPRLAVLYDQNAALDLKTRLADTDIQVAAGESGLLSACLDDADTVVAAMSGTVGLKPTLAAIERGKRIALANKETLVCAGNIVMALAQKHGAEIIPVDSEHSAIFQCLQCSKDHGEISRLILTASGGPFLGYSAEQLRTVTVLDALCHPNWSMGPKITVDSASLMNKGQEFIEAVRLFSVTPAQIEVVIQQESIIHSMVEFIDGSVIAQMGPPDMRAPIQYAMTHPGRQRGPVTPLDFSALKSLTFDTPDMDLFPCLGIAIDAVKTGDAACAALCAADEVAVSRFISGEISFCRIPELVYDAIRVNASKNCFTVDDIIEVDNAARECASR